MNQFDMVLNVCSIFPMIHPTFPYQGIQVIQVIQILISLRGTVKTIAGGGLEITEELHV